MMRCRRYGWSMFGQRNEDEQQNGSPKCSKCKQSLHVKIKEMIIEIKTASKSYSILIEENAIESFIASLEGKNVLLATDSNIAALYGRLLSRLENMGVIVHVTPAGERSKNAEELGKIYSTLLTNNFNRSSTVVALGGGVVGDITGYAAATFMRGVSFVQIPTTLLAMVDSSIGGKVAVNHPLGKNMIGVFKQPDAVYIDPNFLKTLPMEERHCAMAEIIKHALIKDENYFSLLEERFDDIVNLKDMSLVIETIAVSCKIKKQIVEEDENELGVRAALNYGHTLGHALETVTGYDYYKHGQAVAYGMMFAGELSKKFAGLSDADLNRQNKLLEKIQKPPTPNFLSVEQLEDAMVKDKKNSNANSKSSGKNKKKLSQFVLIEKIGLVRPKTITVEFEGISSGFHLILKQFLEGCRSEKSGLKT